jgi:hypothetical protein
MNNFIINNTSLGKIVHYFHKDSLQRNVWRDLVSSAKIDLPFEPSVSNDGVDLRGRTIALPNASLSKFTVFVIYSNETDKDIITSNALNVRPGKLTRINDTYLSSNEPPLNKVVGFSNTGYAFKNKNVQRINPSQALTSQLEVGNCKIQEIIVLDNSVNELQVYNYTNIFYTYFVRNYIPSGFSVQSTFSPISFTPAAWFRGDLGITLTSGKVSQWSDQSGNNRHLVQATAANQPPAITNAINNKPCVQFAALSHLRCSSLNGLSMLGDYSSYLVLKNSNTGDSVYHLAAYAAGSNNQFSVYTSDISNNTRVCAGSVAASGEVIFGPGNNTTTALYAVKAGAGASGSVCRFNNATGISTRNGAGATIHFACGSYDTAGTQQFVGYIAEFIIFQRVITTLEETTLLQYFNGRYQTAWV